MVNLVTTGACVTAPTAGHPDRALHRAHIHVGTMPIHGAALPRID